MHDTTLPPAEHLAAIAASGRRREFAHPGGALVFQIWGEGPPLLLLHGNFGSWRHWARNVLDLARRFTVLVPDMPGCGESDPPVAPITLETIVALLADGLDAMIGGEARFALAAFSFGANMAGALAQRAGDRATQLILVGPAGLGVRLAPHQELVRWRQMEERAARRAAHRRNLEILMIADPEKIDALAVEIQAYGAESYRLRERPAMSASPLRDALPHVSARIAAIWGGSDNTAGEYLAPRRAILSELRPEAGQFIIEDAGHWVQYEAADRFNALMRQILE